MNLGFDRQNSHHARILMVENVAMKHGFSGEIVVARPDAYHLAGIDIDRIFPSSKPPTAVTLSASQ